MLHTPFARIIVAGRAALLAAAAYLAIGVAPVFAQAPAGQAAPAQPAGAAQPAAQQPAAAAAVKPEELSLEQAQIAEKFKRFEQVVKLLAQFSDDTDGEQARLLRQVFAESKSRSLDTKFDALVKALGEKRLAQAVGDQDDITAQLETLLAILSSAEREKELKSEQARLREYLKKVKELINKQREIQGRTIEGDPKDQAPDEGKLADETKQLADKMQQANAKNGKPAGGDKSKSPPEGKPSEGKPSEGKPSEGKPSDPAGEKKPGDDANKGQEGKPKDGDAKPSDGKSSEGKPSEGKPSEGKPSEGKPSQGKPSDGKPSDGQPQQGGQPQPPQESSPTDSPQKRVAAAQQRMEEAQKKLDEAKKDGAVEEQDAALRELEQAKAELEEILRQLREEELARLLKQLEQRFAEMLRMQEAVYRDTHVLHAVPVKTRSKAEEIESGRLSRDEAVILVEADKALGILREEGSAVAFPATCEQMRDDIAQIVKLLAANNPDELTLAIEEDVIAALKEMIEALKKAQKDLKDKKNPPPSEGGETEPPLVDKIAELKMIRSLQLRVNRRTKLIAETAAKTSDPELLRTLQNLAEREQDVHRITRDIVLGKNK